MPLASLPASASGHWQAESTLSRSHFLYLLKMEMVIPSVPVSEPCQLGGDPEVLFKRS